VSKFLPLCYVAALSLTAGAVCADTGQQIWQLDVEGRISWQFVTPIGDLVLGTSTALIGVDEDTGRINWQHERFAGIPENAVRAISGSPFYSVTQDEQLYMLDLGSGKLVFDSNEAGLGSVRHSFFLFDSDSVLVAGQRTGKNGSALVLADLKTGKGLWRLGVDFKRVLAVEAIDSEHLLVVSLFDLYKINRHSGKVVWRKPISKGAGLTSSKGLNSLMKAFAETVVANDQIELEFALSPDNKFAYFASGDDRNSTATFFSFDVNSGQRLWEREHGFYNGGIELLENGLLTLSQVPGGDAGVNLWGFKVNLLDYDDGKGLWGKKGKGLKIRGGVSNYVNTDQGMLISTSKGNDSLLYLLDTTRGKFIHEKPARIGGKLIALYESEVGIVCFTDREINILVLESGRLLFKKSVQSAPGLTKKSNHIIYAYDIKDKIVKRIDTHTGKLTPLNKSKIKFKGGEAPDAIDVRKKGVLLSSSQNMLMLGFDGNPRYQLHFPAPKRHGLVRALYYAQAIRASVISAQSYMVTGAMVSSSLTPQFQQSSEMARQLYAGIGAAYGEQARMAQSVASASFRRANQRFQATSQYDDTMVVLTKDGKNTALFKVEKDTGAVLGKLDLGQNKEPNYALDPLTNLIYIREKDSQITSLAL
jgi:outer membrane protein assembly factor BamB